MAGIAASALVGTTAGQAFAASAGPAPRRAARTAAGRDSAAEIAAAPDGEARRDLVVHVRDARSGEMDVFSGTSQARLRDPELAARLARAIR